MTDKRLANAFYEHGYRLALVRAESERLTNGEIRRRIHRLMREMRYDRGIEYESSSGIIDGLTDVMIHRGEAPAIIIRRDGTIWTR